MAMQPSRGFPQHRTPRHRSGFEHELANPEESTACVYCGDFDPVFREHFLTTYALKGGEYGRYSDAYRLGHEYGHVNARKDWRSALPELRHMWDSRGSGSWDDFREAIRFGWERARK